MEALFPVEDADLAAWCEAWNDGGRACCRAPRRPPPRGRRRSGSSSALPRAARAADAVGALRRHFAFRQDTRVALDLHVRPGARGQGLGGSLLVQLLARARALGAEVIRGYAPQGEPRWDALAAPPFPANSGI